MTCITLGARDYELEIDSTNETHVAFYQAAFAFQTTWVALERAIQNVRNNLDMLQDQMAKDLRPCVPVTDATKVNALQDELRIRDEHVVVTASLCGFDLN